MMCFFYEARISVQMFLLVFSLICIIVIEMGFLYLWKQGCQVYKQICIGLVLLIQIFVFIFMILDAGFGVLSQKLCFHIHCFLLFVFMLLSLIYIVCIIYKEHQKVIIINNTSIKEAFDTLPIGICFFNESGLLILCNSSMYRFGFALFGKDIQTVSDLDDCLKKDFIPLDGVYRDGDLFILNNHTTWYLEKRQFIYENKYSYTKFIAYDVSVLHNKKMELEREMKHLRGFRDKLYKLSANVVAITREEEILNTKMRVHDEMGRCLLLAQKYLSYEQIEDTMDQIILNWQRAVSMMKYHYDSEENDMLMQIRKTCEDLNIRFIQTGELPSQNKAAYILTCAVRECVTNAVRYAEASELYVNFFRDSIEAGVKVSNNGKIPESEIIEGGGLSTLRKRVENAGGMMVIQSFPYFQLTVKIPLTEGEIL